MTAGSLHKPYLAAMLLTLATAVWAQSPGGSVAGGASKVGDGVSAPVLISKVEPEYSELARKSRYQGTVLLYVEVDPTGKPTNIKVQRSLGMGLDEKAIEAVSQWRFKPGLKDGKPVTVAATIEVNFRLINKMVRLPARHYPDAAKTKGIEGVVSFTATIDPAGRLKNLTLNSGDPLLVDAAKETASRGKFHAEKQNGKPVESVVLVDVVFQLPKKNRAAGRE